MIRNVVVEAVACVAACLCLMSAEQRAAPQSSASSSQRLNLISIVTDDQSTWSIGAYGNRDARTPHIDRLAREGARFVNSFVVTPVCSPSRASSLTGRYGRDAGITDWISPSEAADGAGLPAQATTWTQILKQNGYATALIGKWHLGEQPQYHPSRFGIDHFFGFLEGGNTPMDPLLEVEGRRQKLKGSLPDVLVDDALRFVEQNRAAPFALLLHFRAPHRPYGPVPAEDQAAVKDLDPAVPSFPRVEEAQVKQFTREYFASVHSVDRNIGRLRTRLEELGLMDRTIVMFASDNGYMIGHHGLHSKGNASWMLDGVRGPTRPNMFEESIRVPLIVRWPGAVKPGMEVVEPVTNLDTFPSVLGMLGVTPPAGLPVDGADYSPLLRGVSAPWRETIFGEYDLHHEAMDFMRMVRTPQWKLVRHYHSTMFDELYDLTADPRETQNLYNDLAHRAIRDGLQARLDDWMKRRKDPVLTGDYISQLMRKRVR